MDAKLPIFCALIVVCAGCGGAGGGGSLDVTDPASFKADVDHPYFPLVPGTVWVYEGSSDGVFRHQEVRVLEERRLLWGIPCVGIREEMRDDGDLVEVTTEWFAEDRAGNVWKFGEEAIEFDGPAFARTPDSWIVGEGDALPWLMISATPAVGERYYGYRPGGQDVMMVQALDAIANVPAGFYPGCLQILDSPDDVEDQDIILYAAGVGRVQESSAEGRIDLVSVQTD